MSPILEHFRPVPTLIKVMKSLTNSPDLQVTLSLQSLGYFAVMVRFNLAGEEDCGKCMELKGWSPHF